MGGRVVRAALVTPAAAPKGRVFRAAVTGVAPAAAPRGRVYRSAIVGTLPAARKGRVYRSRIKGTAAVVLAAIPARTVEPMSSVEITALLVGGTPAESYIWRQVSGPAVSFIGTGHTRSFTAPSAIDGTSVVIGVRAAVGGTTSDEQTVTVTVRPQLVWTRTYADPAWRGTRLDF